MLLGHPCKCDKQGGKTLVLRNPSDITPATRLLCSLFSNREICRFTRMCGVDYDCCMPEDANILPRLTLAQYFEEAYFAATSANRDFISQQMRSDRPRRLDAVQTLLSLWTFKAEITSEIQE